MKILLVGGLGFVGSSLACELAKRGHDVLIANRGFQNRESQWGKVILWDAVREWVGSPPKVDVVVHLASANGDHTLDSLDTYTNNLTVTRNVLDLCSRIDNAAVLYVSTLQVFGRWTGELSADSPVRPITEYGFSHWVAEEHVKMFARTHNRQSKILRLSNVIGVGAEPKTVRWSTVPAEFCSQAARTHQIVVRSDGYTQRDFISIERAARSVCDVVERWQTWDGQVALVASGNSSTIAGVANLVSEVASELMMVEIPVKFNVDVTSAQRNPPLRVVCESSAEEQCTGQFGQKLSELRRSVSQLIGLAIQEREESDR